jgi:hypothetical protein
MGAPRRGAGLYFCGVRGAQADHVSASGCGAGQALAACKL